MRIKIKNHERGLLFKDGNFYKVLKPGTHFLNPFKSYKLKLASLSERFYVENMEIDLFLDNKELLEELIVVNVEEYEICLHYVDNILADVLKPGKYAYWNVMKKHEFEKIDIRNPEAENMSPVLLNNPKLSDIIGYYEVESYEKGILYYNSNFKKALDPGRYFFWKGPVNVKVLKVDLRQQQLDMTGQEIMTEDKVSLRLNFVCNYAIKDPLKVVKIKSYETQIYVLVQLILREYVGGVKLDDLLIKKDEINKYVLEKLKEHADNYGIDFIHAGIKDIILPGDVKEILNTVLVAEKKARASVITRREEIASTRSLLNTAKMMEENPTLYRLKELEFLEKICDKIGNVSISGGGNLIEQLNMLLSKKD